MSEGGFNPIAWAKKKLSKKNVAPQKVQQKVQQKKQQKKIQNINNKKIIAPKDRPNYKDTEEDTEDDLDCQEEMDGIDDSWAAMSQRNPDELECCDTAKVQWGKSGQDMSAEPKDRICCEKNVGSTMKCDELEELSQQQEEQWNNNEEDSDFSSLGGRKKTRKTKKIRKHKGIHQTGGNAGRLKKGYRYSGKKLKNGLPQIIKCKSKKC